MKLCKEDLEDIADLFNDCLANVEMREVKPHEDALHTKTAKLYVMKRLKALANSFYDKAACAPH